MRQECANNLGGLKFERQSKLFIIGNTAIDAKACPDPHRNQNIIASRWD